MREHGKHGRDNRKRRDKAAEVRAERRRDGGHGNYGDRGARRTKRQIPTRGCKRCRIDARRSWQQPEREDKGPTSDDERRKRANRQWPHCDDSQRKRRIRRDDSSRPKAPSSNRDVREHERRQSDHSEQHADRRSACEGRPMLQG